jgi:DNA-directed RNA polymerase specialized sigma24 family protein
LREVEGWSYGKLATAFEVSKAAVADLCKYRRR